MKYKNPILRGFHPDPSICKKGNTYYLVNSSFEFLPGLPVYKSKDLVNWQLVSHVINNKTAKYYCFRNLKNSTGMYAPTIRYFKGTFYVVCSSVPEGVFIVETEDPRIGWSKPRWIKTDFGIDPSITFVNQKCYLQMARNGKIIQFLINPHNGHILSKEKIISVGTGGRDPEGPHIYYQFGKYWLLLAEGGTREGHMVTMEVSNKIDGPYYAVPNNPILTNRNYKGELQCVGHGDLVQIKKNKFGIVALATRLPAHTHRTLLGRETILLPADWNESSIVINNSHNVGKATINQEIPIRDSKQNHAEEIFNRDNLISIAGIPEYKIIKNELIIRATETPLRMPSSDDQVPSFIGCSQSEFVGKFSFVVDINELNGDQAGLAIYKDDQHYFEVLYNNSSGTVNIVKLDSDFKKESCFKTYLNNSKIQFILLMTKKEYKVILKNCDAEIAKTRFLTRYLTNEVSDSPFTGVVIGVRSVGKGRIKYHSIELSYTYE